MYYTRRAGVKVRDVGEETLVLDDQDGHIHHLNHTASLIWRQCDGKNSITDIARLLALEYDVDHGVATKDVAEAIERFRELKLLNE